VVGAIAPRAESSAPAPRRRPGHHSAESGFPRTRPAEFRARSVVAGRRRCSRAPISIGARPVTSRPEGLERGGKAATRVQTICAVGWESPTGVSDLWRFVSVNRAPPGVAPDDGGGFAETVRSGRETRSPRALADRIGFRDAVEQHSKRLVHVVRSGGFYAAARVEPRAALDNSDLDASHRKPPSPPRSVENAWPGWKRGEGNSRLDRGGRLRREMRRTSDEQPTFQRTSTRAPRRLPGIFELSPEEPDRCRASWRFTGFGSPSHPRGSRHFAPNPHANRLSFDAPFRVASCRTA
jgi:hypothetical protein